MSEREMEIERLCSQVMDGYAAALVDTVQKCAHRFVLATSAKSAANQAREFQLVTEYEAKVQQALATSRDALAKLKSLALSSPPQTAEQLNSLPPFI